MVCSLATVTLTCLITFLLFSFHLLLKIEQTKKARGLPIGVVVQGHELPCRCYEQDTGVAQAWGLHGGCVRV